MSIASVAFLDVLKPAVRQASAIARALEGRVANRPKVGEETPVKAAMTIADSAAQEAILVPLLEHFPEVSLRAEEDTPTSYAFPSDGEETVVVDPIDGTLHAYLEGEGPYAVIVGLARADAYHASIVCLPREGLLFSVAKGRSAEREGAVEADTPGPTPASASKDGDRILVSQYVDEGLRRALEKAGYVPGFGSGGAISVAPLIPGVAGGLRISPGPEGVSVRGRIGLPIMLAAGGRVAGRSGPFPGDLSTPADVLVTAADERVEADLLRILASGNGE